MVIFHSYVNVYQRVITKHRLQLRDVVVHSPRLANFCTYLFCRWKKDDANRNPQYSARLGYSEPFRRNIPICLPTKMGAMPTKVDKSIEIASIVASFVHRSRANAWRRVWRDPSIFRGETIPNFTKRWYKPSKDGWIIIALLTLHPKQLPVLSSYSPILQHDLEVATNYSGGL